MPKELLFEIGFEEYPYTFLTETTNEFKRISISIFERYRLQYKKLETFSTPRRLTLIISGLMERQEDTIEKVIGPSINIAYDKDMEPTKALIGFVRSKGARVDDVKVMDTSKGKRIYLEKRLKGELTYDLLPTMLDQIIGSLSFPKSMIWLPGNKVRFPRPIRWITAIYGKRVIPLSYANLSSSNISYGHRFMAPGAFKVDDIASYHDELEQRFVILDPEARRRLISRVVKTQASRKNLIPLLDDQLLQILVNLVEHPVVLPGEFDERFLSLPREVLITPMKDYQDYIPVVDEQGNLKPIFFFVSNIRVSNPSAIIAGNEMVLRARLEDAMFFYNSDRKVKLADRINSLNNIVYHEELGSVFDKTQRIIKLCESIMGDLKNNGYEIDGICDDVLRAALLCKADLTTDMVKEFPSLQGYMGSIYAIDSGESRAVADCIQEHYLPRFSEDKLPGSLAGCILSIADKIDNIMGMFILGKQPTGTMDAYGVRRQAIGIIRILLDKKIRLDLRNPLRCSLKLFSELFLEDKKELIQHLIDFFFARLKNHFANLDYRADFIDAVLSSNVLDPVDLHDRIDKLTRFFTRRDFVPLAIAFKRVQRILPLGKTFNEPSIRLLEEKAETRLYDRFVSAKRACDDFLEKRAYISYLEEVARLRPFIDDFFDDVMVMVDDEALRENRLALLFAIANNFMKFADFTRLQVSLEE